ncbi:MAG: hypothetical protein NC898_05290 [Candidatus Omnitrophica bacterium]|nr:hypothetical protein [Candidatus Omnitrophota bacterium]MCM8793857.1 hypothetical protein [Candidatus Omnitrophota bacterium]
MDNHGGEKRGEINLGEVLVYLSHLEPPQQSYFVFSEEIQGFGVFCEHKSCKRECPKDNCSGKLKLMMSELVLGKEVVKTLKLNYEGEGKFWLWFAPALKKLCREEGSLVLEVLPKNELNGVLMVMSLVISETGEVLGSLNITEKLKIHNQWHNLEIPFGPEGFDIDWLKLAQPGTLTLEIKIIGLEETPEIKGSLHFKTLAIK